MASAARAIIMNGNELLVMHRNKQGSQYFTLVGGGVDDGETTEQTLVREVYEETGLRVTSARLVFVEDHPEPYRKQYIYLCEVSDPVSAALLNGSEEAVMNGYGMNLHALQWVDKKAFGRLPFRTPQLQDAIVHSLKKGFPEQPKVI